MHGTILSAIIVAALLLGLAYVGAITGPNCPGKDPSYLGWCYAK